MTPEEAAKDAHDRKLATLRIFRRVLCDGDGKLKPEARAMLEEIESFTNSATPSFRPSTNFDPYQAAFEEGMRNVYLRLCAVIRVLEPGDPYDEDEEEEPLEVKR